MTQWTEQPDGTWRRGPLVVTYDRNWQVWLWGVGAHRPYGLCLIRDSAQREADAWAANMLAQLKELENPCNKS